MDKLEKVIKGLECCTQGVNGADPICSECPYNENKMDCDYDMMSDAHELLKAQEQRHRLEVHNIGNVDIPEGMTEEQFYAVMNNVVAALEHTDRGESWPYDGEGR